MGTTIVVTQSNYLPWRGYFDMLGRADKVVLLDCVQYTRRDWRNRNLIRTSQGLRWITIPVTVTGGHGQAIDETRTTGPDWAEAHIRLLEQHYRSAPAFADVAPWLFRVLRTASELPLLSDINTLLIQAIGDRLGLRIPLKQSSQVLERRSLREMDPTRRLVSLCMAEGATTYLTGPAASAYLDLDQFTQAGISVEWMDYGGYPSYPQLGPGFEPGVTIADLLLNCGDHAASYLRPLSEVGGN